MASPNAPTSAHTCAKQQHNFCTVAKPTQPNNYGCSLHVYSKHMPTPYEFEHIIIIARLLKTIQGWIIKGSIETVGSIVQDKKVTHMYMS